MKILYVTTIPGTINAFFIPHIKFLIEQGNEVGVAFNPIQELSPEISKLGCKVHHVNFQRNPFNKENMKAYQRIKKVIMEEKYEVIHVHTPVASLLTRISCRKIPGIKMIYTAHGFHFFKGAPKINWIIYYTLERIAGKWTDGIITMNDEDYQAAKRLKLRKSNSVYKVHGVGLDLNKFIPQTLEIKSELRKEYQYHPQDFLLIYVGELCYRKHQDLLIEAVSKVKIRIPNIKLLLVGDGDQREAYRKLAYSLGLEQNVEFLGFRKDVDKLMSIADIAISTSRQEGLPVNVMEAMATGLPVIVTDCRGNRDLVTNEVNGFVIGMNDAEACAQAIENLYQSEELRQMFAERNREDIEAYSIDKVLTEMGEIYPRILFDKGSKKITINKGEKVHWGGNN